MSNVSCVITTSTLLDELIQNNIYLCITLTLEFRQSVHVHLSIILFNSCFYLCLFSQYIYVATILVGAPKVGDFWYTIMLPSVAAKYFYRNLRRNSLEIKHFYSLCFGVPRILRQDTLSECRKDGWRCIYTTVYYGKNNAAKDGSKSPGVTQEASKKTENVQKQDEKVSAKTTSKDLNTDPEYDVLEVIKEDKGPKKLNVKTVEKDRAGDILVRTEFGSKNDIVTKVTIEKKKMETVDGPLPQPGNH